MRLLWNYLKNYKWVLLGTLVLTAINQIFSLLDPLIFQRIVDRYVSRIDTLTRAEFVSGVGGLLLLGVGIVFVSRVAKNFQDYFLNSITQKLGTKMYADSVSHSFRLPYAVFEDQRSGEFLSKLQSARNDAQQLLQLAISTMFFSIIGVVFVLVYAFITSWIVGLAYLLLMPTLGFAAFYISRGIQKAQTAIVKETQALAGSTTETLRNVELVKSLGLENQEIGRLNTVNDQILALELKKVRMVRTLDFIQGTLINALRTGLTFLMLYLIFTKDITLGQYFSLLIFSFYIFTPLGQLGAVATKYYETKASMAKLQEILAMPVEPQPTDAVKIDDVKDIVFKDLSFGYQSAGGTAVQDISFTITSGETIALAGPSGSGKTTLIKLLVGLYKPTGGQLLYNSTDSQHIDWESFRKNIGLVSQDTQLFAGTSARTCCSPLLRPLMLNAWKPYMPPAPPLLSVAVIKASTPKLAKAA
jgi:ATP-binding cassette subfamily B protein